jgi:hypothetical protein
MSDRRKCYICDSAILLELFPEFVELISIDVLQTL